MNIYVEKYNNMYNCKITSIKDSFDKGHIGDTLFNIYEYIMSEIIHYKYATSVYKFFISKDLTKSEIFYLMSVLQNNYDFKEIMRNG